MTFTDIINRWEITALAGDLGIPVKNIRRWLDVSSIPADWYIAVVSAAQARGFDDITLERLAYVAEARRLARAEAQAKAA